LKGINKQKRSKKKALDELGLSYNERRKLRRWIELEYNRSEEEKTRAYAAFKPLKYMTKRTPFDPTRDEREKQLQDSGVSDPKNEFTPNVAKDELTTKPKKYSDSNNLDLQTGKVTKKEYDPSVEQDWLFNDALGVSEEDMFQNDDRGDLD
jgi:hypothetical protein